MKLFTNILLHESNKSSQKEIDHTIAVVNKIYNEWKKTGRRINAVDLVTTSTNKIGNINPAVIPRVHEATRLKIATIIMRCLDIPVWKDVRSKEKVYKKFYPLISQLETYDPNTGSGGNLREVIMTRLSAAIYYADRQNGGKTFIAYEPTISKSYLDYLFTQVEKPEKTVRMQALRLPPDFDSLIRTLTINYEKVNKKKPLI